MEIPLKRIGPKEIPVCCNCTFKTTRLGKVHWCSSCGTVLICDEDISITPAVVKIALKLARRYPDDEFSKALSKIASTSPLIDPEPKVET